MYKVFIMHSCKHLVFSYFIHSIANYFFDDYNIGD